MGLTICNGFSSSISVAIGWPNSNQCANGGKWIKRGWWNIKPGRCARLYNGSLKNFNRMSYYARTTDRTLEWKGRYCTYVHDNGFQHCWNDPIDPHFSGYYQVCYRLLDVNNREDYTLNLSN